jgi:RNA polymerase sigma-70 factor (ECF subfamily)
MSSTLQNLQNVAPGRLASSERERDELDRAPSFEAVYTECFHDVSRWARAMGGNEADLDDLAQDVFLIVRRKLPRFDGHNLRGWLYRITQRTVRDHRRAAWFRSLLGPRASRDPERALLGVVEPGPGPAERLEQREAERTLSIALSRMRDKHRAVFVLFEIEGYSGDEIAALEGVRVNTIWTRLHHARKDFAGIVAALRRGGGE